MSLFFSSSVTTWTVGYVIPYHANFLFTRNRLSYGIVSLQAKEAKHSRVKEDLTLTNWSNVSTATGKWWLVMQSNYVHSFYLPKHQPMPSSYTSHYQSCSPPHGYQSNVCNRDRNKENDLLSCQVCLSSIDLVTCASSRGLTESVLCALKPVVCKQCNTRFADNLSLSSHLKFCNATEVRSVAINPTFITAPGLKEALCSRGLLSTAGNKEILVKRLEDALAGEG